MILCCGEALIDMLPRKLEDGTAAFAPSTGGAVFNTAIALGRLGARAGYFGGLSRDLFGALLEQDLDAAHVETTLAPRSDRPTTLAFVTLTDGQARYAFYDENTAGRMLCDKDLPDRLPDEVTAMFFGGISLVSEPGADAYAALAAREGASRLIMLDPNIRPGFIRDEASYRKRLERMLALADIVKVSDEDLVWITGRHDPAALLEKGAKMVLMTRGAEPVRVASWNGSRDVPVVPAHVVDTVGAGDTFNAGFLAGLSRTGLAEKPAFSRATQGAIDAAVVLGTRAAAITVGRAGANPPWAHEL